MGSREKLGALSAQEIEHRLRRWQQHLVLAGEHKPLTDHGQAIDVQRYQPSLIEFGRYRMRGYKGDPQTGDYRLFDRLVAAHRHADFRAYMRGLEQLLHQPAGSRAGFSRQESFVD